MNSKWYIFVCEVVRFSMKWYDLNHWYIIISDYYQRLVKGIVEFSEKFHQSNTYKFFDYFLNTKKRRNYRKDIAAFQPIFQESHSCKFFSRSSLLRVLGHLECHMLNRVWWNDTLIGWSGKCDSYCHPIGLDALLTSFLLHTFQYPFNLLISAIPTPRPA